MAVQPVSLFFEAVNDFFRTWPRLLAADLVCKVVVFVALTPLVGLTLIVLMPGDSKVLADQDILFFALSPAGLAALLVMGTVSLAILTLEQACLMTISFGEVHGRRVTVAEALWYGARHAWPVVLMALRILVRCLLIALPFLAAGGLVYLLLLREYDINYYLAQRPPVFFFAAGAVATLLAVMAVLVIRRLLTWAYALPLLLFEGRGAAEALAVSEERTSGTRRIVAVVLVAWGIAAALLSAVPLVVVGAVGRWLVPRFSDSMTMTVVVIGGLLVFLGLLNLAVTLINAAMFALLTVRLYDAHGSAPGSRPAGDVLPEAPAAVNRFRVTVNRAIGVLALAALFAGVAGYLLVRDVRLDNEVVVIAHRGAAGSAPENTLASVALAVEQGADIVEFDVRRALTAKWWWSTTAT
jgi:glycerophosphoryl diester phosphodiesterase